MPRWGDKVVIKVKEKIIKAMEYVLMTQCELAWFHSKEA